MSGCRSSSSSASGRTIGFDIVADKVERCRAGHDPSREIADADMALAVHAEYTSDPARLKMIAAGQQIRGA